MRRTIDPTIVGIMQSPGAPTLELKIENTGKDGFIQLVATTTPDHPLARTVQARLPGFVRGLTGADKQFVVRAEFDGGRIVVSHKGHPEAVTESDLRWLYQQVEQAFMALYQAWHFVQQFREVGFGGMIEGIAPHIVDRPSLLDVIRVRMAGPHGGLGFEDILEGFDFTSDGIVLEHVMFTILDLTGQLVRSPYREAVEHVLALRLREALRLAVLSLIPDRMVELVRLHLALADAETPTLDLTPVQAALAAATGGNGDARQLEGGGAEARADATGAP